MFVGRYAVKLDSKNRVTVPQTLRESPEGGGALWTTFYLTLGLDGCISVYTPEGWTVLMNALGANKPLHTHEMRIMQRLIASSTEMRSCDGQGRLLLSDDLRAQAGIQRDVVWVGSVDRAEIWDPIRWEEYRKKNISQLGAKLDVIANAGLALSEAPPASSKGPGA